MRILLLSLGTMLAVSLLLLIAWYQIDGQPTPEASSFLYGEGFAYKPTERGGYQLIPEQGNGFGVVIMHGALVKPLAYAETAAFFAQRGFRVLVPYGGWTRLSINAVQPTRDWIRSNPLQGWFFIGHSMGGFASLQTIEHGHLPVLGLALWAAAMPNDYSGVDLPTLFIGGGKDGLLDADSLANQRQNFPTGTRFEMLAKANHRNFARYSHQFFDQPADMSVADQIAAANRLTLNFFRARIAELD